MTETPRSSASCEVSTIVTGMPAERKFIEMPPPIVPAPMTPTLLIGFRRYVLADVGDLGRLPLGEEHIALRLGLRRREERHEHLALA